MNHESSSFKRRAPCGPKPDVPRPRPLRNRSQGSTEDLKIGKVVQPEELSNLVVNDLIKEALAADTRILPVVSAPAPETDDEMEDDVLSLSGQSDEEEEVESVDLASRIAKRVVQQGILFDAAKAVQDASQEISECDFEEVESFSEDEEESVEMHGEVGTAKSLDAEAARFEARETLIQAAQSGALLAALRAATDKAKAAPVEEDEKPADVESLRREARDTLLKAARDGRLASAFKEMRQAAPVEEDEKPADVESLRREARDTLLKAARDGRLASAFKEMRQAAPVEEDEKPADVESLRREARDTLLKAARDGRLASAFKEMRQADEVETVRQQASEPNLQDARDKARSALLNTLQTGEFQKAMEEIVQKRQAKASEETPKQSVQPLQESASVSKLPGKAKRRIIGGVVRAPSEAIPMDPMPPVAPSPESKLAWFMAGPASNGLRQKEAPTFRMDDESDAQRGLTRKSSITAMFEALGSAQLIRMDADEQPQQVHPSMRLSASCTSLKPSTPGLVKPGTTSSASAMALDLGLDLSSKDRIGTPSMGSRCSSVGSLRALKASKDAKPLPFLQKPSSIADWSISNTSVMKKTPKEWSTMGTMPTSAF